jgi:hypothetical protein
MAQPRRGRSRGIGLAALLVLSTARAVAGQTSFVLPDTTSLTAAERALLRFEQQRSAAINRHDTTALRSMYASEFRGVSAGGFAVDRSRLLRVFLRDDPAATFVIDEMAVTVLGSNKDTAVLTARLTTRRNGELVTASRFIHVYAWRDDRWQILAAQGTALPKEGS